MPDDGDRSRGQLHYETVPVERPPGRYSWVPTAAMIVVMAAVNRGWIGCGLPGVSYSLSNLLIGILVFAFFIMPLVVFATHVFNTDSDLRRIELDEIPETACRYFTSSATEFAAAGFTCDSYLLHANAVAGVKSYLSIWYNVSSGVMGVMGVILSPTGEVIPIYGFGSDFADQTVAETSLMQSNSAFLDHPKSLRLNIPGRPMLAYLLRVHTTWLKDLRRRLGDPVIYPPAEIYSCFARSIERDILRQCELGLYRPTKTPGRYRLTFKGAFLMTYRQYPIFKQIRNWRRKNQVAKELKRLGLA